MRRKLLRDERNVAVPFCACTLQNCYPDLRDKKGRGGRVVVEEEKIWRNLNKIKMHKKGVGFGKNW